METNVAVADFREEKIVPVDKDVEVDIPIHPVIFTSGKQRSH